MSNHKHKAFTLVEILIVIVIIGILTIALIPKIISVSAKARNVGRTTDIRNISTALSIHLSSEGFVPNFSGSASSLSQSLSAYIKSIPKDPSNNKLNGMLGSGATNCTSYLPKGEYGYLALANGQGFAVLSTMDDDSNVSNYNRGYSGEPLSSGSIMYGCIDNTMTAKQLSDAQCDITGFPGGENLFTADFDDTTTWKKSTTLNIIPHSISAPYAGLAHQILSINNNQGGRFHLKPLGQSTTTSLSQDTTQSIFVKSLIDLPSTESHIGFSYGYTEGGPEIRKVIRVNLNTETFLNRNIDNTSGFVSLRRVGGGRYLLTAGFNKTPTSIHVGKVLGDGTAAYKSDVAVRKPHLQYGMTAPCGDIVQYNNGNKATIQRRYIEVSN